MDDALGDLPRHWWALAVRGLLAIAFGLLAWIWPAITLGVLVTLFGAYTLVDGVLVLFAAVRGRTDHPWIMLLEGIVGILAGLATFIWPALTALVLLYIIAVRAILTGVLEIVVAIRLRSLLQREWALAIAGVLSMVFGAILIAVPGPGALAVVWLIGAYAVVFGVALLGLAWRLRRLSVRLEGPQAAERATAA